ncbi:MAG: metallophosphoesterase [Candidatus Bathyarchaeota archaeon]|nr:MAG: metallophosphoesterase [Candidatus Bathyarchaeota archaeon]
MKNYPALLLSQNVHKTLIISDLHLGWEINLSRKGIHIPSQMEKILQKLLNLLEMTRPRTLMILGDIKDTIAKAETGEWRDVPAFFEALEAKVNEIQILRGNHDGNLEPLLPPSTQMHPATGITLGTIGFFHGHTWPSKKLLQCKTLVIGHIHPTIAFRDSLGFRTTKPVWIKARCDTGKLVNGFLRSKHIKKAGNPIKAFKTRFSIKPQVKELLIVPIFNDFLGGRPINRKRQYRSYIGPLLRSQAVDINKAEAYLLDGSFLGTIEQLKSFH